MLRLVSIWILVASCSHKQPSQPPSNESSSQGSPSAPAAGAKQAAVDGTGQPGGDGTAMALDEGKKHPISPAGPPVPPLPVTNEGDFEAKVLAYPEKVNKLLVAGLNRDCEQLAADLRKLHDDNRAINDGVVMYAQDHHDLAVAVTQKLQPKFVQFYKTERATRVHCKDNSAFLDAVSTQVTP
jgi:hypothetical protein